MYHIEQYQDGEYQIYKLTDSNCNSWLKVAPERGGLIIGFGVEGEELLFLNKDTFHNPDVNVRGGIPILFPISGQLNSGQYEWNGKTYHMNNHGVARNYPWEVVQTNTENEASICLKLSSSEEMKKSFPFDFEVVFTYTLKGHTLTITQEYQNQSDTSMPIYAGFHPYFWTKQKDLHYTTDAQHYFDYNDLKMHSITESIDLSDKKESLALIDSNNREISFELPEAHKYVTMQYGPEFKYIYLWSEADQDFVCVEPWMARTGELHRKQELVEVGSHESLKTFLKVSVR
ncbi:galactose mutarotase-like enzyme [Peribacillus deserti]|uniref:Galactose mutarotase-like enzyme n=1 Tax=Peribacillus deserti TaxID=673318 RepID=A0ABS2QLM6_9BACI|nr:aldose epimerase [Peribacillus deserti]MBM7693619.1 galactose mutarotase-like enzyme [Peribacillus deserti]